ncbi:MAG: hypothetical protein LBI15_04710 [Dysgonamonadaceae bacterium]|jgi:hypothetical protein|nr:hypothetical protein [Dysgonamonadaceae bacterium]
MDFKKIIIDGYRQSDTTHIVDEQDKYLGVSSRVDYFVQMAKDATAEGITSEQFFYECERVLERYEGNLMVIWANKSAGGHYKECAFQVDDNGEKTEKECHTIDGSILDKLRNDLERAKMWLKRTSETNKKNSQTTNKPKNGKQHTPFSERLPHNIMEKVRELINKDNSSGIHIAKVLEALQHKQYILINSYYVPQVITEFDIQCSKTAINKYLNKGKFYINPTRLENGITAELQQIVDMLP